MSETISAVPQGDKPSAGDVATCLDVLKRHFPSLEVVAGGTSTITARTRDGLILQIILVHLANILPGTGYAPHVEMKLGTRTYPIVFNTVGSLVKAIQNHLDNAEHILKGRSLAQYEADEREKMESFRRERAREMDREKEEEKKKEEKEKREHERLVQDAEISKVCVMEMMQQKVYQLFKPWERPSREQRKKKRNKMQKKMQKKMAQLEERFFVPPLPVIREEGRSCPTEWYTAVRKGDRKWLDWAIKNNNNGLYTILCKPYNGHTMLDFAIEVGNRDVILFLLDIGVRTYVLTYSDAHICSLLNKYRCTQV